jgi:hypothetical protein
MCGRVAGRGPVASEFVRIAGGTAPCFRDASSKATPVFHRGGYSKSKCKQLQLRTYDITFDNTKYDLCKNNVDSTWWKISIYDNHEVLKVSKNGISATE